MLDDKWIPTRAGRHLKGRSSRNTEPELLVRSALHRMGARFRLHRNLQRGCTPDIVLPRRRIAVFVDGDFWHGCPKHDQTGRVGGPNAELWRQKIAKNRMRDARATELAERLGWRVARVWECEVRADAEAVARRILSLAE